MTLNEFATYGTYAWMLSVAFVLYMLILARVFRMRDPMFWFKLAYVVLSIGAMYLIVQS